MKTRARRSSAFSSSMRIIFHNGKTYIPKKKKSVCLKKLSPSLWCKMTVGLIWSWFVLVPSGEIRLLVSPPPPLPSLVSLRCAVFSLFSVKEGELHAVLQTISSITSSLIAQRFSDVITDGAGGARSGVSSVCKALNTRLRLLEEIRGWNLNTWRQCRNSQTRDNAVE